MMLIKNMTNVGFTKGLILSYLRKGKRISNGNYGIVAYGLGWTVKKRGWADYEQL